MKTTLAGLGLLAAALGVFAAASCGAPKVACEPSNCAGCCNAAGTCVSGKDDNACGMDADDCVSCDNGQTCVDQVCSGSGAGGGSSAGGGSATGGGSSPGGGSSATGGGSHTGGGSGATGGGSHTGGGSGTTGGGSQTGGGGGS